MKQGIREKPEEEGWRRIFANELGRRNAAFIDLVSEFYKMPREKLEQIFNPR